LVDECFDIGIRESWTKALEDVKAKGGKPYAIPAGASVHKLGGLGYVGFADEVRAQEKEMHLRFDYSYCVNSTRRVLRVSMRLQHGQRGSVCVSATINRLCSVAIEFGT
jgi:1-aminocyclopropane-1-carboxylate deaminase/D-cysteine desulfhydrase-like pyridoxal-dependent ACC family enzyme